MELVVLVDNNTLIDTYFYGEPGLSYFIEDEGTQILLDTGYSDLFIQNAKKLDIDLGRLSAVVISHGHDDHTGGLPHLINACDTGAMKIIAHPDAFVERVYDGHAIGSPVGENELTKHCDLSLSSMPVRISKNIWFLGEIPVSNNFETRHAIGKRRTKDGYTDDFVTDDSALVYRSKDGLYIITGCSHSGICNIIEYAKKVSGCDRILGVIGGFHLFKVNERLAKTIDYLVANDIRRLYPCHCCSFKAKAEMNNHIPVNEVGVGTRVVF